MPYRVRKINWRNLLDPTMAGLQEEARGDADKNAAIRGGVSALGSGIVRGRQEKESRRRFDRGAAQRDRQLSVSEERLSLTKARELERARDEQARETTLTDIAEEAGQRLLSDLSETGKVAPETMQAAAQAASMLGGVGPAVERVQRRMARGGKTCGPLG